MNKKNIQLECETKKISNAMLLPLQTALNDSDNFDFNDIQIITHCTLVTIKNFLKNLGVFDIELNGKYKNLQSAIDKLKSDEFFSYLTRNDLEKIFEQVQGILPDILYKNSYQLKQHLIDKFN